MITSRSTRHRSRLLVVYAAVLGLALAGPVSGAVADPAPTPSHSAHTPHGSRPAAVTRWSVSPSTAKGPDGRTTFSYPNIKPGSVVHDYVGITNLGSKPVTFALYAVDGVTTADGDLGLAEAQAKRTDLGAWTHLARAHVTVKPRQRVNEPFTVTVPRNATPGDHVGGVVASVTESGKVRRENRFGVAAYLRVAGPLTPTLSVDSVSTRFHGTANPFGGGGTTVSYTVHNTGNVRLSGAQTVSISGLFGTEARVHPAALAELLPGDSARVTAHLSSVFAAGPMTAHVSVTPMQIPGAPHVTTALKPVARKASLWASPWPQFLLFLLLLTAGLGTWWWRRRHRRRQASLIAAAHEKGRREAAELAATGVTANGADVAVTSGPARPETPIPSEERPDA